MQLQTVELFEQQQELSPRYTVSLQHASNHYETSSFPRHAHLVDLSLAHPILIPRLRPHHPATTFLQIVVSPLPASTAYDTTIDQSVLAAILQQD